MQPLPTQLSGAKFLADRRNGMLADEQRVGKTGATIMAADYVFARSILVVTTASGRSVWRRGFDTWSKFGRSLQVALPSDKLRPDADVIVVSWGSINTPALRVQLMKRHYDLVISDEDHWAKSFDAARTQAFYGEMIEDGGRILIKTSLAARGDRVWPLTGTPLPNSPLDAYPRLRVLAVDRLLANPERGWPDVVRFSAFRDRYTKWHPMKIGRGPYARLVDVVTEGQNEEELRARTEGFSLRRTQADVGIRPPIFETLPLIVSAANRRASDAGLDTKNILEAAEAGRTRDLEMELGPKRRLTGEIKARAVIEAVKEEFAGGLDKVVLAFWHKDVGAILAEGLSKFGVVGIDGSTSPDKRLQAETSFRDDPKTRVFLGQIVAAGEAIDLSAASELIFVEASFVPKDMAQMSARISNITQKRSTRVRVATLEGSVDDALQSALLRKWSSIRKVIS
jgi:SWI/SNF-related matrix-associated actin-dependent regulator 1 of chromatin subfamily A